MKDELLVNTCNENNITEPWVDLVRNVTEQIKVIGGDLIAFYVVGSVTRGSAVKNKSDVDFLAITRSASDYTERVAQTKSQAEARYKFAHHIDIDLIPIQEFLSSTKRSVKRFVLKTQSVLLLGTDIRDQLPEYRINKELAIELLSDFDKVVQRTT